MIGTDLVPDDVRKSMIAEVPLRRLTDPQDVANAMLYLASEEASFVAGVSLNLDGAKASRHGAHNRRDCANEYRLGKSRHMTSYTRASPLRPIVRDAYGARVADGTAGILRNATFYFRTVEPRRDQENPR